VARTILHVDLDAFYASVEQRDDPRLRGLPVVVGGASRRGVVCAASYEARRFGVRSAMPMGQALRLCPQAQVISPRFEVYSRVSAEFFAILRDYSPLVEGLSLDEAFLDVTGEERLFGDGPTIAATIRERARRELSLTVSAGVAPSKFIAKIASDLRKPDALVVVAPGQELEFLHPLPVSRLWGVGKVAEEALAALGLTTIGQVARADLERLVRRLGREHAAHLRALSLGLDERAVEPDRLPVSVGHEDTFMADLKARPPLAVHLLDQADRVCARLRDQRLRARIVVVKIKFADHERVSRRRTLAQPTADGRLVGRVACELLEEVPGIERRGVRLTGVSAAGLEAEGAPRQLGLDESELERGEALGAAIDRITSRFGGGTLRRAVHVDGRDPAAEPIRGVLRTTPRGGGDG
jgi:DNA polymerase-4